MTKPVLCYESVFRKLRNTSEILLTASTVKQLIHVIHRFHDAFFSQILLRALNKIPSNTVAAACRCTGMQVLKQQGHVSSNVAIKQTAGQPENNLAKMGIMFTNKPLKPAIRIRATKPQSYTY